MIIRFPHVIKAGRADGEHAMAASITDSSFSKGSWSGAGCCRNNHPQSSNSLSLGTYPLTGDAGGTKHRGKGLRGYTLENASLRASGCLIIRIHWSTCCAP